MLLNEIKFWAPKANKVLNNAKFKNIFLKNCLGIKIAIYNQFGIGNYYFKYSQYCNTARENNLQKFPAICPAFWGKEEEKNAAYPEYRGCSHFF